MKKILLSRWDAGRRMEERDRLIRENPDYGVIICRCEEISKGKILDALNSPLPVCTVDGIKKRLLPGMGRCQGGFCMPLVAQIISEHEEIPLSRVKKPSDGEDGGFRGQYGGQGFL